MKIVTHESARLGESYKSAVLDNGLSVYAYHMPNKQNVYALLGAGIGSVTRDFTLGDKKVSAPAGVAHFLEHKLFESEKGDAFELFAKTGASANAYTSFERTCYLFSTSINAESSLKTLLSFVGEPHFTAATVKKEQGIIGQEIKMYDDSPDWQLTMLLLGCLYKNHPVRDDIAGTVETIAEITPEVLYDCYNAFYRPENMALCVAGNLEPEAVFEAAERIWGSRGNVGGAVKRAAVVEPREIMSANAGKAMRVAMPQFCLGFKHSVTPDNERIKRSLAYRLLLSLLFGDTSPFYTKLYDEGLINETFDASTMDGDDFCCTAMSGETNDLERVRAAIITEIERVKREGLDAERFEEHRRALVGTDLCAFDGAEGVATRLMNSHFKHYEIYDIIEEVENIKIDEVNSLLCDEFDESRSALVVIEPQQ